MYVIVVDKTISDGEIFVEKRLLKHLEYTKEKGKLYTTYTIIRGATVGDIVEVVDRTFYLKDVKADNLYVRGDQTTSTRELFGELGLSDRTKSICLYGGEIC